MTFFDKVKELCKNNGTTITAFEREIGMSKGSAVKWKKSSPNTNTLMKVATYFNVPMDYFTDENAEPVTPDAKNILESLIASLGADAQINFSASEMPDDEREHLENALQTALDDFALYRKLKQQWQDDNQ